MFAPANKVKLIIGSNYNEYTATDDTVPITFLKTAYEKISLFSKIKYLDVLKLKEIHFWNIHFPLLFSN